VESAAGAQAGYRRQNQPASIEDICFVDAIHLEEKQAVIDQELCKGCGRCVTACPNDAIEIDIANDAFINTSIERLEKAVDVT